MTAFARIHRLFIANRGEISCRIARTCRRVGVTSVAAYSDVDAQARHVVEADESVRIGAATAAESYANGESLLAAGLKLGCDAVHPGYGFLSESADFARMVEESGMLWVGPRPAAIAMMGLKVQARSRAKAIGVPISEGSDLICDIDAALAAAHRIGYPVLVKASAGGGGAGMEIAENVTDLKRAFERVQRVARTRFHSPEVYVEEYFPFARHIEVQIVGFGDGTVMTLGLRDCSVQRRRQKLVEEAPPQNVTPATRHRICASAEALARSVDYRGVGTVEFLLTGTADQERYVFLEMNTRIQVEHPVTELVTGLDLVELQLRIADDPAFKLQGEPHDSGHAIEARVYAEDAVTMIPSPGVITTWDEPEIDGVRVDAGYACGQLVSPHYDSLLAKVCAYGSTREEARHRLIQALDQFSIEGPGVNIQLLRAIATSQDFAAGSYDTNLVVDVAKTWSLEGTSR